MYGAGELKGIKILSSLNIILRAFLVVVCCSLLQACVSSSLDDAAPKRIMASNLPTALDQPLVDAAAPDVAGNIEPRTSDILQTQTLSAETSVKYDKQGFPTFAETPRGEVDQLSTPEKIAIETKMTELLLSRSNDENVRAGFEAKLRRLRVLAETHEQNADVIISQ